MPLICKSSITLQGRCNEIKSSGAIFQKMLISTKETFLTFTLTLFSVANDRFHILQDRVLKKILNLIASIEPF